MSNYTHQTVPTQFVEAAGIRLAYRRFGKETGVPLLFFIHFTGTMEVSWNASSPALHNVESSAADHPINWLLARPGMRIPS